MAYPKLTPITATGSTEPRYLGDRFADVINVLDYGVKGDGTSDDTEALQAAAEEAENSDKSIFIPSGTYLVSDDISFSVPILFSGQVKFIVDEYTTETTPEIELSFYSDFCLSFVDFYGLIVVVADNGDYTRKDRKHTTVSNCKFINSKLIVGQDSDASFNFSIKENDFQNYGTEDFNAIKIVNISNLTIDNNTFESFYKAIDILPSTSFAATDITIENNVFTACKYSIQCTGSSLYRVSKITINNNTCSTSRRLGSQYFIHASFCVDILASHNSIAVYGKDAFYFEDCIFVKVSNNQAVSTQCFIRASSCSDMKITSNECSTQQANAYSIFIAPSGNAKSIYRIKNINISHNKILTNSMGITIRNAEYVLFHDNEIRSMYSSVSHDVGLLHFNNQCTKVYYWGNNIVSNDDTYLIKNFATSGDDEKPAAYAGVDVVEAPTIGSPLITDNDSDMGGGKTYVVEFGLKHYSQIHQLWDATNQSSKKLSEWMTGVSGATLAWNSAAGISADGSVFLPGLVFDGIGIDYPGQDKWNYTSTSLLCIDKENRLTCREHLVPVGSVLFTAAQINEQAWNTASFRAPLVVDGTEYGDVFSEKGGYGVENYFNYQSGRTVLGQKATGTYVLLVADGSSGTTGATMHQCALKMLSLNCVNAFNLDGGGSTTLWYNGNIINQPSDAGGERNIACCMYV